MLEGLLHLFQPRPLASALRDVVDLLIVAYAVYRSLLVLRGTRAMQMGAGLGIVFAVYVGAKYFDLVTLYNLLSWLLSSIILVVVVVFQNDIRRALIRMGSGALFSGGREQQSRVIDEVVAAATELARHRMGAIIAFEQDANILEFVKSEGIVLEAAVTRELLVSLFVPESVNKLHDGAVLIRDLKIARAGVFFPMPDTKILDASLGSRHRAALGITEETDAVVVVVSEERGTISFCFSGNIVSNLDGQSLRHALFGLFDRSRKARGAKKPASAPPVRPAVAPARATSTATQAPGASAPSVSTPLPAAPRLPVTTPKPGSVPLRPSADIERSGPVSTPIRPTATSAPMPLARASFVPAPPVTTTGPTSSTPPPPPSGQPFGPAEEP